MSSDLPITSANGLSADKFWRIGDATLAYWNDRINSPRTVNLTEGEWGRRVGVSICIYLEK